jgi:membrane fusion protein (multidrug efflux system)
LAINDNSDVKAGQVLFRIDPRLYVAARDQARANLALAQAELTSSEIDLQIARVRAPATLMQAQAQLAQAQANAYQAGQNDRRQHTVDPSATTQTSIDNASAVLKSQTAAVRSAEANEKIAQLVAQNIALAESQTQQARAKVAQAEASLASAEVNLSYTVVTAPQDGFITQRNVDLGTYVQAGQQSLYLVSPQVWVVANFKEDQLARMHPGQKVTMTVDAYPSLLLKGHLDSIQAGSGARFSAFPAENATGNFVKIVRRVPVKIIIDSGLPEGRGLPLGLSVEPTVQLP